MKLIVEIPKEYEIDFNTDKFSECFSRVLGDITYKGNAYMLCGNYEKETIEMLKQSFKKATVVTK